MWCDYKKGGLVLLAYIYISVVVVVVVLGGGSEEECRRKAVIFNFGDSNSDTGGLAAAMGYEFGYPDGRAFFHGTGRLCDGRLIIDFLCKPPSPNTHAHHSN